MINPLGEKDTPYRRSAWMRAVARHERECPSSKPLHLMDEGHRLMHLAAVGGQSGT